MKHRNPLAMLRNARAAIPIEGPLSANQIHRRQDTPRLPLAEVRILCEEMYQQGEVDRIEIGFMVYYRRAKRRGTALALRREPSYTSSRKTKVFPVSTEVNYFLSALYPLTRGTPVLLRMEVPRTQAKNKTGPAKRLVALVPWSMPDKATLLVAVVGAGSCFILPGHVDKKQTANLVLAGMPVKLATLLQQELNQLFKD